MKTTFLPAQAGLLILSAGIGALSGSIVTFFLLQTQSPTQEKLIRDFYQTETAVYVSPHGLRKMMDKGDQSYILVDVRSTQEYETEHIVGALNIPAYKNPDTSISLDTEKEERERIVGSFRELTKQDKDVIVYCYSLPCMTGRKIGTLLAENDIYVKHLGIGWNEWRYFWSLWNHDGETPTDAKDYVVSGKEPGKPKINETLPSCPVGELGC